MWIKVLAAVTITFTSTSFAAQQATEGPVKPYAAPSDDVINQLAAELASANSAEEVAAAIQRAVDMGLTVEQIAFALGIASQFSISSELVSDALKSLLQVANADAETVNAAFLAGSSAISPETDSGLSEGAVAMQSPPLGTSGMQGIGTGGGASPR